MCCRTRIHGLSQDLATGLLITGQFLQEAEHRFHRDIGDARVVAYFEPASNSILLSLSPSISTWQGHFDKRDAIGVMYEIATRYAEKIGGRIEQEGINVAECMGEGRTRLLAQYPELPMRYENLCPGFKAVFLGE